MDEARQWFLDHAGVFPRAFPDKLSARTYALSLGKGHRIHSQDASHHYVYFVVAPIDTEWVFWYNSAHRDKLSLQAGPPNPNYALFVVN